MLAEPIRVTLLVVDAIERLDIPYYIGGSFASTLHGVMRSTMDADLIVDLREEHVNKLVSLLGAEFYADEAMIRDAIQHRGSFNLIHLETMFKVDVFIVGTRPFDRSLMQRRTVQSMGADSQAQAYMASAEDIILAKLEWFRLGGEVSDRQWRDVIGVLKIQAGHLDEAYLRKWAQEIGVLDLLERAQKEM